MRPRQACGRFSVRRMARDRVAVDLERTGVRHRCPISPDKAKGDNRIGRFLNGRELRRGESDIIRGASPGDIVHQNPVLAFNRGTSIAVQGDGERFGRSGDIDDVLRRLAGACSCLQYRRQNSLACRSLPLRCQNQSRSQPERPCSGYPRKVRRSPFRNNAPTDGNARSDCIRNPDRDRHSWRAAVGRNIQTCCHGTSADVYRSWYC